MIKKYRKNLVVIEAVQFTGENKDQVFNWIRCNRYPVFNKETGEPELKIETLDGDMIARFGDYIIKDVKGEFYPCKPDIFEQAYSEVNNEPIKIT